MAERKILAGHAVRRLRRTSGLTQVALADALEISPSYLNLIEKNRKRITVPGDEIQWKAHLPECVHL